MAKKKKKDISRVDNSGLYPKLSEKYYWEYSPNENEKYDYYYYLQVDEKDYHISGDGVFINYENGDTIHTNLIPKSRFKNEVYKLSEESLFKILDLPIEGFLRNDNAMNNLYEE